MPERRRPRRRLRALGDGTSPLHEISGQNAPRVGYLQEMVTRAKAIAEYEPAICLRPDYSKAGYDFGFSLAGLHGHETEAIAHFEAVLKIKPDLEPARTMLEHLCSGSWR